MGRTDVVVTRGRRAGRIGYIYGRLPPSHPLVTKVLVMFGPYDDAAIPAGHVAPLSSGAPAQLTLALEPDGDLQRF